MRLIVAITGGSGAVYAIRLLQVLKAVGAKLHLVISRSGALILRQEIDLDIGATLEEISSTFEAYLGYPCERSKLVVHDNANVGAVIASGSFKNDGMVIVPCSMSMLAAINAGIASDLISRAASVMIKEHRPLVVVPREMPLSEIHLRNMLSLCRMGVHILPPMPGFYHSPSSIEDLVDFVVGRILDVLGIEHEVYRRWEGMDASHEV